MSNQQNDQLQEYYNEILGPPLEPTEINSFIVHVNEKEMHWTEQVLLGYKAQPMTKRDYGDNNKSDPFNNIDEEL